MRPTKKTQTPEKSDALSMKERQLQILQRRLHEDLEILNLGINSIDDIQTLRYIDQNVQGALNQYFTRTPKR